MIGFVILIVFLFLLGQAILETIWGICLLIYAGLCHIACIALRTLSWTLHKLGELMVATCRQPEPIKHRLQ